MKFIEKHWLALIVLAILGVGIYLAYQAYQELVAVGKAGANALASVANAPANFVAYLVAQVQSILPSWLGGSSSTTATAATPTGSAAPAPITFSDGTPINASGNFYIDPTTGVETSTPSFINYGPNTDAPIDLSSP